MKWHGDRTITDLLVRGLVSARRAVAVIFATGFLALVQPYLLAGFAVAISAQNSTWDALVNGVGQLTPQAIAVFVILSILKSAMLCWFTDLSFRKRNLLRPKGGYIQYVMRFLILECAIYVIFGSFGALVVFLSALFTFPINPIVDKALIACIAIAVTPMFVLVVSFTLYWSYNKGTFVELLDAIARSVREYGTGAYAFFGLRVVFDFAFGVVIPILALQLPLPYFGRLSIVAFLTATAFVWLRGVGFEFNNSLFWNDNSREFRY